MIKKNFTKKDLANKLHKRLGFSKNYSLELVGDFFDTVISELINKNIIKISSFGTFEVFNKKERVGRNPKTKKEFIISARKVVRFKPSLLIKNKLNKI
jgi:integration host factor subunit alpha